jgi:succinate dehydrogenase/fumarate reductase flavoprotein subunit
LQKVLCDTDEHDRQPDEQPTLFHVLHMQKRSARVIQQIQDEQRQTHYTLLPIMRVFMTHFQKKCDAIEVDDSCIAAMVDANSQPPDTTYTEQLERPIDIDEIHQAVLAGRRHKAPGSDGLGLKFYKFHLKLIKDDLHAVLNQMYLNKAITPPTKARRDCLPAQELQSAYTGRLPTDHTTQC